MGLIEESLRLYKRVVSERLSSSVIGGALVSGERACVFTSAVTIWLMIFQRLHIRGSLSDALSYLRQGSMEPLLDKGSIRVRGKKISGNTGGYSRARQRVSVEQVRQVCDELNAALEECRAKSRSKNDNVYVVDGSTLRLPHTDSIVEVYPQKRNQHGLAHYPILRLGVITNAVTGVVARPAFGPYDGSEAIGEISLASELFERVPKGSIIVGDRYYGSARIASEAKKHGHDVVARVKERDAKKYIGIPTSRKGQLEVEWHSTKSRTGNEYQVAGKFIWYTLERKGFRPQKLILFTTLTSMSMKDVVELYALRWNVELDLRALKSTLKMDMLHSKDPDTIAKEIYLGFAAYNLIRHVAFAVAIINDVQPREISFSAVLSRVMAAAQGILSSDETEIHQRSLECLLLHSQSLKLPNRKNKRCPEPRKVWPKGQVRIMTQSREEERKLINPSYGLNAK